MAQEQRPLSGRWFDPTINLGHILTFLGFIIAGFVAWTTLDKRVVVLEEYKTYQQRKDADQDQVLKDTVQRIDQSLLRLDQKLDTLKK